mgnify:CR=1 FL=1
MLRFLLLALATSLTLASHAAPPRPDSSAPAPAKLLRYPSSMPSAIAASWNWRAKWLFRTVSAYSDCSAAR